MTYHSQCSDLLLANGPSTKRKNNLPYEFSSAWLRWFCLSLPFLVLSAGAAAQVKAAVQVELASPAAAQSSDGVTLAVFPTEPYDVPSASTTSATPVEEFNYGDSITACRRVTDLANCYVRRIAGYYGITSVTDRGISGNQACDVGKRQVFSFDSPNMQGVQPLRTLMVGTNDVNNKGLGAYEATFDLCDQAVMAWLTVPVESKVLGASVVERAHGTCAADSTYAASPGIACSATDSRAAFPIATTGGPVYIWYRVIDGDTGTFTYAVDGGFGHLLTTALPAPIATETGYKDSVALARVPVPAGNHTIYFVQVGAGTMGIVAVGTPPNSQDANLPYLIVGDVPKQLDGLRGSTVTGYNADVHSNVSLLAADGLLLHSVPTSEYLLATTAADDMTDDGVHPNDTGHEELFSAFLTAVEQLAPPSFGPTSPFALKAAVVPAVGVAIPTGQITFYAGKTAIGTASLAAGVASVVTPLPPAVGDYQFTAQYAAGAGSASGNSPAISTTVVGDGTATLLTSPDPSAKYGTAVTFVAVVKATSKQVPVGTVTFATPAGALATLPVDSRGTASLECIALPVGRSVVTATFVGQNDFGTSASNPVLATIAPISTITVLKSSAASTYFGSKVSLVAGVISEGMSVTSGQVMFWAGNELVGAASLNSDGLASFTTSGIRVGGYNLKATFAAEGKFGASQSVEVPLTVLADPDFLLGIWPSSLSVVNGKTENAALSISPEHGFDEKLTYSVKGLPVGATLRFGSPATQSGGKISVPFSITTHSSLASLPITADLVLTAVSPSGLAHSVTLLLAVKVK